MAFEVRDPPLVSEELSPAVEYTRQEILRLVELLNNGQETLMLQTTYRAPEKPRAGMVVFADGALWNPGDGLGVYVYSGSAWIKL